MKETKIDRTSRMLRACLTLDECRQKVRDLSLQLEVVENNRDYWKRVSNNYKNALRTLLYWDCDICRQYIPSNKFPCDREDIDGAISCEEAQDIFIENVLRLIEEDNTYKDL